MAVSYSSSSVTVKDGALDAVFTVHRSGTQSDLEQPSSVAFHTTDNTAIAGIDYTATNGLLSFPAGATEGTISVAIDDAAYHGTATKTFVLVLAGSGSAAGSIQPATGSLGSQTYIYVPDSLQTATVPTEELIANDTAFDPPADPSYQNIKYQTNYTKFSDPETATVAVPFAYFRVGYARGDMNIYERVITNSDAYVPKWAGHRKDGRPIEIGTLSHLMLPRGVDRKKEDKTEAMTDNKHLDGLFIYSDKNYNVTVNRDLNEVIQGNYIQYVAGRSGQLYMGAESKWTYYDGPLRSATGLDKLYGAVWQYDISSVRKLSIASGIKVDYALDLSFSSYVGVRVELNNAVKYTVSNGIDINVKGLQASIDCDVGGDFAVEAPGAGFTSTRTSFSQSVSESIVLSVDTGLSTAWTLPVQTAVLANTVAAGGASTASWISEFSSNGYFFKHVDGEGLSKDYKRAFTADLPVALGSLSVVTAAIVLAAAQVQKKAHVAPLGVLPQISMNAEGITMSAGEESMIEITAAGIVVSAPTLELLSDETEINSDLLTIFAPEVNATTSEFSIGGDLSVGDLEVAGDGNVLGSFYGTFVNTP